MKQGEIQTPWERSIRNNKILTVALVFVSLVAIGLVVAICYMMPLKTVQTQVVEYRTGTNNFVTVHKANEKLRANEALVERELARYVIDRETVDKITESERYPRVYAMTTEAEAVRFRKLYGGEGALYHEEGFTRNVEILRTSRLSPNVYQIEFRTHDTKIHPSKDEAQTNTSEWVATLKYGFKGQITEYDERLKNPLGIFIERYNLARRKS